MLKVSISQTSAARENEANTEKQMKRRVVSISFDYGFGLVQDQPHSWIFQSTPRHPCFLFWLQLAGFQFVQFAAKRILV